MTITPEMLMAYADGELDAISAKRVEKAIDADPALADQVAAHRGLRDRIALDYAPIAAAPVPDALAQMVRDAGKVTPIETARRRRFGEPARLAFAAAAALAIGIALSPMLHLSSGDFANHGGTLVADGHLKRALNTQLADASSDAPTRMLVSFRNKDGDYCRVFEQRATGGIACNSGGAWQVREMRATPATEQTAYRQAGSQAGALMAAAQDMMAGAPLDAAQERAAKAQDWTAH